MITKRANTKTLITPVRLENFKSFLIGGARGGGGSNYTGSLSGTVRVGPCP